MASPELKPLGATASPDMSPTVLHMVGRKTSFSPTVKRAVKLMSAKERLEAILDTQCIHSHSQFCKGFESSTAAICFTEATDQGVAGLVSGGMGSFGLAFSRDFLFARGGGPVLYIRGDEWDEIVRQLPPDRRFRAARLWPGWTGASPPGTQPGALTPSDWAHEREWRIASDTGEPPGFRFELTDVQYILLPSTTMTLKTRADVGDIPIATPDTERMVLQRHST